MSIFHKIVWILLHTIANIAEKIYEIGLFLYEILKNFQRAHNSRKSSNYEKSVIEEHIHNLKKIPQHLAVLLNCNAKDCELPKYENLANLVCWAFELGINYISFYDYRGILKSNESEFHEHVRKRNFADDELIVWGPEYQQQSNHQSFKFPHKNGFKNYIVVNIFSYEDGKLKICELVKNQLCKPADNTKNNQLTIDFVDEKMKFLYGSIPDPDLAVYFGTICSTYGFLPWQIRLTEFFQIDTARGKNLKLNKLIDVLYKFAKVEQRFGK